jgi:hypothetical protein
MIRIWRVRILFLVDTGPIVAGIHEFITQNGGQLVQSSDLAFEINFEGDRCLTYLTLERLGMAIGYSTKCGRLPDTAVAPALLRKNWGGVFDTCFFLSVNVQDGVAWLTLETMQLLPADPTAESVTTLLKELRVQCGEALDAINKALEGKTP